VVDGGKLGVDSGDDLLVGLAYRELLQVIHLPTLMYRRYRGI